MKTIEIEKELKLKDAIDLLPVSVHENFVYEEESDGIRCVGPFFIHGRYTTLNEVRDFQDVFEFDVFAANEKLDGETFKIAYQGYDYSLQNGITLIMHFNVFGIKDDKEDGFSLDIPDVEEDEIEVETYEEKSIEKELVQNIKDRIIPQEIVQETKVIQESKTEVKQEQNDEDTVGMSMMEELFEEKDNVITSYSFVVVKKEDSYESIAHRYDVDVETLKDINAHQDLHEKGLIVLPYGK